MRAGKSLATARHIHLQRAARSAGEALAWRDDDAQAPTRRSRHPLAWLSAGIASAAGMLYASI